MPIVASVTEDIALQADGRSYVRERHTDHGDVDHVRIWLADADADLNAELAAYAATLPETLKQAELDFNLSIIKVQGSLAKPYVTGKHFTMQEGGRYMREAYRNATRDEAIMMGDYFNTMSDAQLMNAFQITQAQVTNLRTNKLAPATQQAETLRTATGI